MQQSAISLVQESRGLLVLAGFKIFHLSRSTTCQHASSAYFVVSPRILHMNCVYSLVVARCVCCLLQFMLTDVTGDVSAKPASVGSSPSRIDSLLVLHLSYKSCHPETSGALEISLCRSQGYDSRSPSAKKLRLRQFRTVTHSTRRWPMSMETVDDLDTHATACRCSR